MCFIRINPETAPLNPPGAAPTLTTIYDEAKGPTPSEFDSPTSSLSKQTPPSSKVPKAKQTKHRYRLRLAKAAPASAAVEGTAKEKQRTQEIADSLDLGVKLSPDLVGVADGVEKRRGTVIGDGGLDRTYAKHSRRLDIGHGDTSTDPQGTTRRSSVG